MGDTGRGTGEDFPPGSVSVPLTALATPPGAPVTARYWDFGTRSKSPQQVQVIIGSFPLANSSRKRRATGPKNASLNEFLFRLPIWPEPS